jgi:pimeloyl-ACP methyl ester carboxylesterase
MAPEDNAAPARRPTIISMITDGVVTARDGLRLATQIRGVADGSTVVAVHGYPDDHSVWDGVAADLGSDHRVVTYDVRGAGASGTPPTRAGYRLDQLAADLGAVLDAVSPHAPVHLLAHDWGAIQVWHAVTDARFTGRVASFTSISGPCLDHVAAWYRRRGPGVRGEIARQALRSWYTVMFRLPRLPELVWRSGLFGRVVARSQGVPRPDVQNAVNGLALYRENIAARMAAAEDRRTTVPVQVLAPRQDRYVSPALQRSAEPFTPNLTFREIDGGHWVVRHNPALIAHHVRTHVARDEG